MKVAVLEFNPIMENTYVVWDETSECIIIDSGAATDKERARLDEFIASRGLKPVMTVNTHGHFDHLLGAEHLRQKYSIPFAVSGKDKFLIDTASVSGSIYGIAIGQMPQIDIDLDSLQSVEFGNSSLQIIATPGHTPGHVSLFEPTSRILFTGDTLFRESIGRTDLPGGDYSWIMRSILDKLLPLGDDVKVYPGHGESTSIGHESLHNPFITEVINEEVNYK